MTRFAFQKGHPSCSIGTTWDTGRLEAGRQVTMLAVVNRVEGNGVQN